MELLDLCYDILIYILEEVNPADLAHCSRTCWAFNNFIKDNQRLFKAHYLRSYDDPRRKAGDTDPSWIEKLQRHVKLDKILSSSDVAIKVPSLRDNFRFIGAEAESLIHSASEASGTSRNLARLTQLFKDPRNLDAIMYRSSLYQRAGTAKQLAAVEEQDRQLSAKLHSVYGVPAGPGGRRSLSTHPYARSRVYDLRNYTDATKWGPYRDDGSMKVNWEMIESIMIVLGYNSSVCCQRYSRAFQPVWSEPFQGMIRDKLVNDYPSTLPMEPAIPLEMKDPFNTTGFYMRIVCFLDYNDLYGFNFATPAVPSDQPREPINTEEAIRHITMRLKVDRVEPAGQFDNQSLPIVHFSGVSRSIDMAWDPNANSRIRGTVRLTQEGEVRWTTISIFYGGEERWRSEGIQVGGPNSKRGVIGTWFDKDYDPQGPVGPTAFWKVSDKQMAKQLEEESEDEDDFW
ncbi:hypothetical protein EJ04DRAFT_464060 [Polyplosphaeria fusca]|uniref:F-box domain-containing protein n=1 Tax=Polyplosphaeria fusca TaxID=682080 RepID=A0A9P4R2V7_9PLEO|nr:hypothetical protein EJ04DRAFT_464060 [Polyplosphaeria fusca]